MPFGETVFTTFFGWFESEQFFVCFFWLLLLVDLTTISFFGWFIWFYTKITIFLLISYKKKPGRLHPTLIHLVNLWSLLVVARGILCNKAESSSDEIGDNTIGINLTIDYCNRFIENLVYSQINSTTRTGKKWLISFQIQIHLSRMTSRRCTRKIMILSCSYSKLCLRHTPWSTSTFPSALIFHFIQFIC